MRGGSLARWVMMMEMVMIVMMDGDDGDDDGGNGEDIPEEITMLLT